MRATLVIPLVCALAFWCDVQTAHAQRVTAAPTRREMQLLDRWIVTKFHGAQLLVDSVRVAKSGGANGPFPRVEVVRAAATGDTVIAMHFAPTVASPALRATGVVRLADASGAMTALSARVLARRMFRAPRIPGASADSAWRVGWAYVAVVQSAPRAARMRPERSWLLVDAADSTSRRVVR